MKTFPSVQQLKKQAEAIRRKIAAAQNECALKTFEGLSGAARVLATGRGEICAVEFLDADGLERADLAEQVMAAANEALRKARKAMDDAAAAAGAGAGL